MPTPLRPAPACRAAAALALLASAGLAAAEPPPAAPAWQWAGGYKADLLHTSAPSRSSAVGNLGLRVDADAGALLGSDLGWDDTALHAELLANHGAKPNQRVGTVQGISNLEVAQGAARLYATWVEHEFKASGTRLLFGLYDLNSDFYATDASGLLIHPSFGIGIDFSQSGRNGPSIFPNLGLALRLRQAVGDGGYVQAAIIDGVPGDPAHPGRTSVRLSRDDGALLVGEAGWQAPADADAPQPAARCGVGAWHYTQRSERIDGAAPQRNQGVYALGQAVLRNAPTGRSTGFVRAGAAQRHLNSVDLAFDTGVLVEQPFGAGGPSAFTAGLAVARFGRDRRAAQAALGEPLASNETAVELGVRWQISGGWAVQPLLQHVWRPGGRRGAAVSVAGLRMEWSFNAGSR